MLASDVGGANIVHTGAAFDPDRATANSACTQNGRLKPTLTNPLDQPGNMPVPSSRKVSNNGSYGCNRTTKGAKNTWVESGCQMLMNIATYNARSIVSEDRVTEL